MIAISAFEVLDAIVPLLMNGTTALLSEGLAALTAYERFLARVDAIVIIEIGLIMGGVTASTA